MVGEDTGQTRAPARDKRCIANHPYFIIHTSKAMYHAIISPLRPLQPGQAPRRGTDHVGVTVDLGRAAAILPAATLAVSVGGHRPLLRQPSNHRYRRIKLLRQRGNAVIVS